MIDIYCTAVQLYGIQIRYDVMEKSWMMISYQRMILLSLRSKMA